MGNEWQKLTLGEICSLITDGKHGDSTNEAGSGYFFLSVKDVFDNRLVYDNARQITEQDFLETHRRTNLEYGDILFTNTGTIGRMAIAPDDPRTQRTTFQKSVAILKPKRNLVVPNYLYYTLKFNNKRLSELAEGTTQKNLLLKDFRTFDVKIPPIHEQLAIAHILGTLDHKVELNRNMNQTLEKIGQSIFRHWFVHFEFPDENGQPYNSSGGEMVDSELEEIPMEWEVQEIGNVIETTGGGTPSTKNEEYWENGNIQWFSPSDITSNNQMFITNSKKNINKIGLKKSSATLFPPYSLMMTSRATVGELSINTEEACTNQGFITCIPNKNLSTYYLYFWIKMNKKNIISLATGSTFREINKSTFRALKIIIPNEKVLSTFNSLLKPIFNKIEILQTQNEELSQIRNSILPKLMSGKIRVNIDEEASAK